MSDVRRKRPWWQWVLGALLALLILGALFGEDDKKPVGHTPAAPAATTSKTATADRERTARIAPARTAADDGRYARAVLLASDVSPAARDAIKLRIANRIARRALVSIGSGALGQARARLGQADRFPATALTRQARTSYRTAKAQVAARAKRRRDAAASKRRAAADARAAREQAAQQPPTSNCDPNYAGACLNSSSPDYDCAGGSGNGPDYTGTVQVVGNDHFDLDRDGDGTGCE
ncbi:MAG: hypothetical protein QOJ46_2527 [bacterium]